MSTETDARWCERCNRLVDVGTERPETDTARAEIPRCPQCDEPLVHREGEDDEDGPPKAPWHFKVLLLGTIGYLIYRLIWFIGWISHH